MIVGCLGYGYIAKYLLNELSANGVRCYGITDNQLLLKKERLENITLFSRKMTLDVINKCTHLVVTAPPEKKSCPILFKYKEHIKKSNVNSVLYVSTTGVYGDHKGAWVDEQSITKGTKNIYSKSRIDSENFWIKFCKSKAIILNIIRLSAIYGPGKVRNKKDFFKNILIKENHYFSRVHVLDIARLMTKILCNSNSFNYWNISDEQPSTRKEFVNRIIKLKNIKKYKFINYEDQKESLTELGKKFWEENKKVSSEKIKKKFNYIYLFPNFRSGLKHIIKHA